MSAARHESFRGPRRVLRCVQNALAATCAFLEVRMRSVMRWVSWAHVAIVIAVVTFYILAPEQFAELARFARNRHHLWLWPPCGPPVCSR